jgi:hypothetical protein
MNIYACLWNGRTTEVVAKTTLEAQEKAWLHFQTIAGRKRIKGYDITVVLTYKDAQPVTHIAVD